MRALYIVMGVIAALAIVAMMGPQMPTGAVTRDPWIKWTVNSFTKVGAQYLVVDLIARNPTDTLFILDTPKKITLKDKRKRTYDWLGYWRVEQVDFRETLEPDENTTRTLMFRAPQDVKYDLIITGKKKNQEVTIPLGEAVPENDTCDINDSIFGAEYKGYSVGVTGIKTRDFGDRGRITSFTIFAKKPDVTNPWHGYSIRLHIRRAETGEITQYERSLYSRSGESEFSGTRSCLSGDMITTMPLPLDGFDTQVIRVDFRKGNVNFVVASETIDPEEYVDNCYDVNDAGPRRLC